MKILELFAGTRSISKAFERHEYEAYTVDYDGLCEYIVEYCEERSGC